MCPERQPLPVVRVYSRPDCHLCELLITELRPQIAGRMTLEVVDIDTDERWSQDYATRIPVVEIDGRFVCQYRLDPAALRSAMDRCAPANTSA
ncbi:MAG: hypothetical protein BMS9Abin32_423 [Gammaproteobacteria bacterium]|nr:MAG: hypothetical protein BMS9Abin32_423 [Gammaproteobacteria bacterium]